MVGSDSSFLPQQRWQIAPPQPERVQYLSQLLQLHPLLTQVLLNRGFDTPEAVQVFLNPELQILPSPLDEFEDLPIALELLLRAIANRQFIAICGDYDADGMTSTALLLRALRFLGATVDYAIPSRMQEGYGLNRRIVEELHQEGVGLILTVDNGIAAHEPIALARELGIAVIVTDHHDIPPTLPNANAILNPKLIREDSHYRGVAGVGVAYILAICLAQSLQKMQDLTTPLIELFTLGTIADLAPLTGVNRRWVKRGLKLLPRSRMAGVQALIQIAGLSNEKSLKPEAIGFRLGPRINAIGRISDPQIIIELLTTDDDGRALELAMKCEQVNQLRQRLCELIEQEAIAWCLETQFNPQQSRVLVIVQPGWHHGVIGIVASRLVERYGVPVFIGTYEEEGNSTNETEQEIAWGTHPVTAQNTEEGTSAAIERSDSSDDFVNGSAQASVKIRGSARGIPEFDVFEALQFCGDLLEKFGGHRAAGGFTFAAENLEQFRARLEQFAHQSLRPEHLKPLVTVDVQAEFRDLTLDLYERMDVLHPCGIENPDPVFWTTNVHIVEQRTIGQNQAHLKLTLAQVDNPNYSLRAVAWRWGVYYPLPDRIDVAYRLRLNEWNGVRSVELELVGVRPISGQTFTAPTPAVSYPISPANARPQTALKPISSAEFVEPNHQTYNQKQENQHVNGHVNKQIRETSVAVKLESIETQVNNATNDTNSCFETNAPLNLYSTESLQFEFYYSKRKYTGGVHQTGEFRELRISNLDGQLLIIQPERRRGFVSQLGETITEVDVSQPHYFNLIRSALMALELAEKDQLIAEKDLLINKKDQIIAEKEKVLSEKEKIIAEKEKVLSEKDQVIAEKEKQLISLSQQLENLQQQLEQQLGQTQPHFVPPISPSSPQDSIDQSGLDSTAAKRSSKASPELVSQASPEEFLEASPELFSELSSEVSVRMPAAAQPAVQSTVQPTVKLKPDDPKQRLKFELGEDIWNQLDSRSQKDLVAAYKKQVAIQTDVSIIDYSDVGLRLCSVIEREVIQPFFKEIHQFLLENDEPCEIGGVTLRTRKKYTLGMLPPLLAAEWHSFQEDLLNESSATAEELLCAVVAADQIDPSDRDTVQVFLSQWEHPLAFWLQHQEAASMIAQIDKLLTIAADAENTLYEWQLKLLQTLILGTEQKVGILKQIYSQANV